MSKTNAGLIEYCKAQLGLPYWYGTFGQMASASLYNQKKNQYPQYYTASDFSKQYGQRVHDCAGLIKGYLWSDTPTSVPKYNAAQDYGATGFYKAATKKGTISSFDYVPGRLMFRGSGSTMKHVGVYIGDGYVVEAKGHAYGVVKTKLSAGNWTHWAQCHLIAEDAPAEPALAEPTKPNTEAEGTQYKYTVKTNGSALRMRSEPNTKSSIIDALSNGSSFYSSTIVEGESIDGNTQWVKYQNGYLSARYLTRTEVTSNTSPNQAEVGKQYKVTARSGLRYRIGPGTSYATKGVYSYGDTVIITETKNGWGKATNGYWSSLDYLA